MFLPNLILGYNVTTSSALCPIKMNYDMTSKFNAFTEKYKLFSLDSMILRQENIKDTLEIFLNCKDCLTDITLLLEDGEGYVHSALLSAFNNNQEKPTLDFSQISLEVFRSIKAHWYLGIFI